MADSIMPPLADGGGSPLLPFQLLKIPLCLPVSTISHNPQAVPLRLNMILPSGRGLFTLLP